MKHVVVISAALLAAGTAGAQQRPEIRQLGPVVATADSFANVTAVRHLSSGSVLVNDVQGRRVVLLDSALTLRATVADSTSATANAYSGRIGGLIPYRGDSTLFTDPQSMSMLVIAPNGTIGRSMAVPRTQDAMQLVNAATGNPGFDAQGRLVYRSPMSFNFGRGRGPGGPGGPGGGVPGIPEMPDSQAIVRMDLATRKLDTIGMIKIPRVTMSVTQTEGRMMMRSVVDPLPVVDDWAVLSDGSVAFIRGRDYRLEYVNPDGSTSAGPKVPFDWQRLSDEDKVVFIDSVRAVRERLMAEAQAAAASGDRSAATNMAGAALGALGMGGAAPTVVFNMEGGGGRGGPPGGREGGAGRGQAMGGMPRAEVEFIPPQDLPDYKPPFFVGASRADLDGNVWIRTIPTRAIPGGPVYDVINRKGELVDRVQIPEGRAIIGFGHGGAVYMTIREGGVMRLEKAYYR